MTLAEQALELQDTSQLQLRAKVEVGVFMSPSLNRVLEPPLINPRIIPDIFHYKTLLFKKFGL